MRDAIVTPSAQIERLRRLMPTTKDARADFIRLMSRQNEGPQALLEIYKLNQTLPVEDREEITFGLWTAKRHQDLKLLPEKPFNKTGQRSAEATKKSLACLDQGYFTSGADFRARACGQTVILPWGRYRAYDWGVRCALFACEMLYIFAHELAQMRHVLHALVSNYGQSSHEAQDTLRAIQYRDLASYFNAASSSAAAAVRQGYASYAQEDMDGTRALIARVYALLYRFHKNCIFGPYSKEASSAMGGEENHSDFPVWTQSVDAAALHIAGVVVSDLEQSVFGPILATIPDSAHQEYTSAHTSAVAKMFRSIIKKPLKLLPGVVFDAFNMCGEAARPIIEARLIHHLFCGSITPTLPIEKSDYIDLGFWPEQYPDIAATPPPIPDAAATPDAATP